MMSEKVIEENNSIPCIEKKFVTGAQKKVVGFFGGLKLAFNQSSDDNMCSVVPFPLFLVECGHGPRS